MDNNSNDDLGFSEDALEALLKQPSESGNTVRNTIFEDYMPALDDTFRSDQVTTVVPKVEVRDENQYYSDAMLYRDNDWVYFEKPKRDVSWIKWGLLFMVAAAVGVGLGVAAGGQAPTWEEFVNIVDGLDNVLQS